MVPIISETAVPNDRQYGESNLHVLDDVMYPVFLLETDYICHATFRIDKIAL